MARRITSYLLDRTPPIVACMNVSMYVSMYVVYVYLMNGNYLSTHVCMYVCTFMARGQSSQVVCMYHSDNLS